MIARLLRRAGLGARGVSRPRDLSPAARVEPLEQRRLLAATPFVEAGGGTFEGGTLNFNVGVRVGYGERVAAEQRFTVGVSIGGEAMPGFDYVEPTSLSVTVVLPSYGMSATAPLSILTLRDNRVEDGETLIVKATSISGPNAGAITDPPPQATGWIGDDPPRISIEGGTQVNESDGRVFLTARRSGGDMTKGISGVIETSGPAIRGEDYNVPGGVTFAPNECVANVELTLLDDTAIEAPVGVAGWSENAIIAIGDGGNGYVATGTPATVAIADDAHWRESQWTVFDPMEALPGRILYGSKSGTATTTYGVVSPGTTTDWTEKYYIEDSWVWGAQDFSGDWDAAAELNISKTYSTSVTMGAELGFETPEGVSLTVSTSVTAETGSTANFGPKSWQGEDKMYRAFLYLKKRSIICVRTSTMTGATGTSTSTSESVVESGYILGDHDWYVEEKTREWVDDG